MGWASTLQVVCGAVPRGRRRNTVDQSNSACTSPVSLLAAQIQRRPLEAPATDSALEAISQASRPCHRLCSAPPPPPHSFAHRPRIPSPGSQFRPGGPSLGPRNPPALAASLPRPAAELGYPSPAMQARTATLLAVISLSLPQVYASNFTFSYGNASQCESFNISWSGKS